MLHHMMQQNLRQQQAFQAYPSWKDGGWGKKGGGFDPGKGGGGAGMNKWGGGAFGFDTMMNQGHHPGGPGGGAPPPPGLIPVPFMKGGFVPGGGTKGFEKNFNKGGGFGFDHPAIGAGNHHFSGPNNAPTPHKGWDHKGNKPGAAGGMAGGAPAGASSMGGTPAGGWMNAGAPPSSFGFGGGGGMGSHAAPHLSSQQAGFPIHMQQKGSLFLPSLAGKNHGAGGQMGASSFEHHDPRPAAQQQLRPTPQREALIQEPSSSAASSSSPDPDGGGGQKPSTVDFYLGGQKSPHSQPLDDLQAPLHPNVTARPIRIQPPPVVPSGSEDSSSNSSNSSKFSPGRGASKAKYDKTVTGLISNYHDPDTGVIVKPPLYGQSTDFMLAQARFEGSMSDQKHLVALNVMSQWKRQNIGIGKTPAQVARGGMGDSDFAAMASKGPNKGKPVSPHPAADGREKGTGFGGAEKGGAPLQGGPTSGKGQQFVKSAPTSGKGQQFVKGAPNSFGKGQQFVKGDPAPNSSGKGQQFVKGDPAPNSSGKGQQFVKGDPAPNSFGKGQQFVKGGAPPQQFVKGGAPPQQFVKGDAPQQFVKGAAPNGASGAAFAPHSKKRPSVTVDNGTTQLLGEEDGKRRRRSEDEDAPPTPREAAASSRFPPARKTSPDHSTSSSPQEKSDSGVDMFKMSKEERHAKQQADLEAFMASMMGDAGGDNSAPGATSSDNKRKRGGDKEKDMNSSVKKKAVVGRSRKVDHGGDLPAKKNSTNEKPAFPKTVKKDGAKDDAAEDVFPPKKPGRVVKKDGADKDDAEDVGSAKKPGRLRRDDATRMFVIREVVVTNQRWRVEADLRKSQRNVWTSFAKYMLLSEEDSADEGPHKTTKMKSLKGVKSTFVSIPTLQVVHPQAVTDLMMVYGELKLDLEVKYKTEIEQSRFEADEKGRLEKLQGLGADQLSKLMSMSSADRARAGLGGEMNQASLSGAGIRSAVKARKSIPAVGVGRVVDCCRPVLALVSGSLRRIWCCGRSA